MTHGIEIRDPQRNGRRIGPPSIIISTEESSSRDEDEDTVLLRITPNEPYRHSYTFSTKPEVNGLRSSDTHNLKSGNSYELTLRRAGWWWMYEDEMADGNKAE